VLPIGDTSVWVLRADGTWESVTAVKNAGEAVASSAVFALPLLPADTLVPLATTLGPGDALFVVTDGIGDPLGSGAGDVGDALRRIWASPPNRYEFAAQVDFGRRSHTDDRTVVGIWPDQPTDEEPLPSSLTSAAPQPSTIDLAPARPTPPAAPASVGDEPAQDLRRGDDDPIAMPAADAADPADDASASNPQGAEAAEAEAAEVIEVVEVVVVTDDGVEQEQLRPVDPVPGLPEWEPLPWEPPAWSLDPAAEPDRRDPPASS
jgi:hypothetical protein